MAKEIIEDKIAVSFSMKLPIPGIQYSSIEVFTSFSKSVNEYTKKDKEDLRKLMEQEVETFTRETHAKLLQSAGSEAGSTSGDEDLKKRLAEADRENQKLRGQLDTAKKAYLKLQKAKK